MRPIVLTIAGSDPSAGAGIQADLKAIEANGGYGVTVITAITAQNSRGVSSWHALPAEVVLQQAQTLLSDFHAAAIKTGMLANADVTRTVAGLLDEQGDVPYVLDPVMTSGSGHTLLDAAGRDVLLGSLLPRATLVTPNAGEAEALTGHPVHDLGTARRAAARLIELGARAVLVKGGHLVAAAATDLLKTPEDEFLFEAEWIETPHTHGTGCIYSAAIAAGLAHGFTLYDSVRSAKRYVTEAIRHGLPMGQGHGPTDALFALAARRTAS